MIRQGKGLIGIYFNGDEFDDPEKGMIDILPTVNYQWGGSRGGGWSARWFGFIEGPITGEVTFIAEAQDGVRLIIGNTVVIDGLRINGPRTGKVKMTKGKKEPVKIEFTSSNRKALLRLYWQWPGKEKEIVPAWALSHSTDGLPKNFMVFDYNKRPSRRDDDEGGWVYPADEFPVGDNDLSKAEIVNLNAREKVLNNAADMLVDEIEKRTRITLPVATQMPSQDVPAIVIGIGKQVTERFPLPAGLKVPEKAEGYAIWLDKRTRKAITVCLAGTDKRGALFAAGRLLRLLKMSRDRVGIDNGIKIATAPKYPLRGHQFGYRPKTNSYDGWDIRIWEQYYRDMIAFGMNAVELIPPRSDDADDSPHFPKPQLEMMVAMSKLADDYDLDVWIWYPAIDDDYTQPKTIEFALNERREVFSKLPRIDAVFVPGGDPGDTPPRILLSFMKKQKELLNRYHPEAQIWVSPQGFDRDKHRKGWLKTFYDILQNEQPQWLDGVVFGPQVETSLANLRKEVPARYPIRRYPDITHCRSCQYPVENWDNAYRSTLGREPINPRPRAYAKIFRDLQQYAIGFITYSEGCNDDFNKVLWSCLGWDPDMKVEQIAREYSRYFISSRFEEKFAQGLLNLEKNWEGPTLTNPYVYKTLRIFQEMEEKALPQEKLNWRFQQGLYRAYYDAYIKARLEYETELKRQAREALKQATTIGSLSAVEKAEAILDKARTNKVKPEWRARVFELAEALFQSIRMQLSVKKYQAIRVNRGANLDNIDKPLVNLKDLKQRLERIRLLQSEQRRLKAIEKIIRLAD